MQKLGEGLRTPKPLCPSFLQVEMGPFKHTVDDGLDVRKAAFECMYSLLESCLGQLDICEFLNHVEDGLKDHYDIRVRCALPDADPAQSQGARHHQAPAVCPSSWHPVKAAGPLSVKNKEPGFRFLSGCALWAHELQIY